MNAPVDKGQVCIVAILKGEEPFIDEWIAYHRIIGVDHFFLYDNDPKGPLRHLVEPYAEYVTVIDWPGTYEELPGRNTQTKAYEDSLRRIRHAWVAFIDGDEFIVLRQHPDLPQFLAGFNDVGAVLLTWHLFGHNGYENNPRGLITAALTRRRGTPGRMMKSINKVEAIASIPSAHYCNLHPGQLMVDANKRPYSSDLYAGKTDVAHINHYFCRSHENWLKRVDLGAVAFTKDNYPRTKDHRWRFDRALAEKKFVEMAVEMNETADDYMLKYAEPIRTFLRTSGLRNVRGRRRIA